MSSFDIVSEINLQEMDNAVNQTKKEIESRYDFKGTSFEVKWDHKTITLIADEEYRLTAMKDILQTKVHRRGIDLQALKFGTAQQVGGKLLSQTVTLITEIEKEIAKKIMKDIRDSGLKVQPQIQDAQVRVTSKSRDLLQNCIAFVKSKNYGLPLQFTNFRE